jgi:hypothetical protein
MAEGVRIHVMPKEFWDGKAVLPEVQKTAALVAPLPVAAIPAPLSPGAVLSKKDPRKQRLILAGGVILFAVLATGAWYGWSLSHQTPIVVVETPPVETKPVEVKPVETKPEPVVPPKPTPGKDTDSDGITDGEERLYGTDARNPDSDADSFLDGNEVFHRYDPLGPSPQTLLDTGTVAIFTSADTTWSVYYPIKWKASEADGTVVFQTGSTAKVTVTEQVKVDATTPLADWYKTTLGKNASSDIKSLLTKNGYQELLSNDKLTAYVDAGQKIFVFTYDLKEELSIDFLSTFQMMVNSFLMSK